MKTKKVLVTGGTGYIGSIAAKKLLEAGCSVVVLDKNNTGEELSGAAYFYGDLTDTSLVDSVFKKNNFNTVMHFGAYKNVGESMDNPSKYSDNINGLISVLRSMVKYNVPQLIFSSTSVVYEPTMKPYVEEESSLKPINFYGFSKLECERIIDWFHTLHDISYICFRYFNVVGGDKPDPHSQCLFPFALAVINGEKDALVIHGNDYDTPDGTCIRDYIHVEDIVDAHILGIQSTYSGIINLGTETGFSVKEIVALFEKKYGEFPVKYGPRRRGDPPLTLACTTKAKEILGWVPKKSIEDSI